MALTVRMIRNKAPYLQGDILQHTPAREKELVGYGFAVIVSETPPAQRPQSIKAPKPPAYE